MLKLLLQDDLDGLDARIDHYREKAEEALAHRNYCRADNGAHDDPAFLEADADLAKYERKLGDLRALRRRVELITRVDTSRVSPGTVVRIRNLRTEIETSYVIAGCRVFDDLDRGLTDGIQRIGCDAGLAQLLRGSRVGQQCHGKVNEHKTGHYEVISIDTAPVLVSA